MIELYNKKGDLIKRIHGPEQFLSQIKEHSDGNIKTSNPIKGKAQGAYRNPINTGEEIFVLFNGKLIDEEGSSLTNKILVFDWNGNPLKVYLLNQDIFAFTVDAINKKIYGISDNPEYHIIEFSY